jgi:2-polyprenyl-3-methyl-5-hydroxy-6-metoxy-1,4-benzoquinol methylase
MADKNQIEFYDNFVQHFDEQKDNYRNASFRNWIVKWIRPGIKVLDFGCALGYNSGFLKEKITVTGVDISPECIRIAKERYPECSWLCMDVCVEEAQQFFPDEQFDCVIMSDAIEHVPSANWLNLFRFLNKHTAKNAIILASVPNVEFHEQALKDTPQPVEEKVEIPLLLDAMQLHGFKRVISLFLFERVYYRMVIQKVD